MYKCLLTPAAILLLSLHLNAQISFSNQTSALLADTTLYSGAPIGIADMNGDSLDDIIRLSNTRDLTISYQQSDGSMFTDYFYGSLGSGNQWGMCIADVDANGYNDILAGGNMNNLKLLKADGTGSSYTLTSLTNPVIFLQGVNFADIDNNGTTDIFACHDVGLSAPFSNDGNGNFTHDLSLINPVSTVPSDNSGNYGSIWTDYDNDGDLDMYLSKCRIGVSDPADGRRLNLLFQNDGNNNYTDVAPAAGLQPMAQSWAADFGDIDNDGDLDCILLNHDVESQLFQNNGDGTFTDITASSGLVAGLAGVPSGIQCIFDDFDNDGFIDLLVTSRNSAHRLFQNNGDLTFTQITDPFPTISWGVHSAVTGDLNNDGYLDIYAGFASGYNSPSSNRPDKLLINIGGTNNYFKLLLKSDNGNINAIGAKASIYGDWGMQLREVRSGEGYGIMNSFTLHFGLGTATQIDSVIINWPDGTADVLCGLAANQSLALTKNNLPNFLMAGLTYDEVGLEVSFLDDSEGIPGNWSWDFGDGGTSTLRDPVHTFPGVGPYTVTLTISNDCETDTYTFDWVQGALPLDLLSFTADLLPDDQVALRWKTAHELDFDYFELEHTTDFRLISHKVTLEGKYDFYENNYEWLDQFPEKGKNYYRLKQVDLDGSFEYSDWVAIELETSKDALLVYPNPVSRRLYVRSGASQPELLRVYNAAGILVLENDNPVADFELDVSEWRSGIYFLQVLSEGEWRYARFSRQSAKF